MCSHDEVITDICRNIVRAAVILKKELDKVLSPTGLSGPQFGILVQLDKHGRMPLNELGKRLWVSCGNVTGLVDKLDAAGYVRRIRLDTDRRVILAEMTDKGHQVIDKLRPLHRQCLQRFTAGLDPSELHGLSLLLKKIYAVDDADSGLHLEEAGSAF